MNAGHYALIVKEMAVLRAGIAAGSEITRMFWERSAATPELVDRAQHVVYNISEGDTSHDPVPIGAAMKASYTSLVEFAESGRELIGVSTGFRALDRMTAGLQPGNLIIVAARPSMGKSALAHKIAANLAVKDRVPVLLFSLEMSEAEVSQRLWTMQASVEGHRVRAATLTKDEWVRVQNAVGLLEDAPLYIDDSPLVRVTEIRSKARRLKTRVPDLGLIVVDYLQLMTSGQHLENRTQEVSQITRALKILARDLDLPVIALSQLSRKVEERIDKRPMLQDLRESGSIEQDADVVMFVYREDYYTKEPTAPGKQSVAELIVAKQRNGPTDTVRIGFEKSYARFRELSA
jgi:replicative DNA helicase